MADLIVGEIERLEDVLALLPLEGDERARAERLLAETAAEAHRDRPSACRMVDSVERVADILRSAGLAAGGALVLPLLALVATA